MKAWIGMAALLCAIMVVGSVGSAAPGDTLYTHPGRLIDVNGHRINMYCMGSGSPTVVFDSGWEDWAPAWAIVQPAVATWTRACSYDRAGSGFSDPGPMPRTSVRIADDLHTALHNAGVSGPYILVGHSFGSYNMRVFADRFMPEVAGLVLVDGEDGDVESAAQRAKDDRSLAPIEAELRECRNAIERHATLPSVAGPGSSSMPCDHQFFRGLPERDFSPALNAAILHIVATKVALYDAVISEMQEMPWDERYLRSHLRSFGSRPVRVLTAQNHFYDTSKTPPALHRKHLMFEHKEALRQARWLSLSSNSKQIFAMKSGHYIELDQPQVVIDAIRQEISIARHRHS
jgi:pimeloyl-ACP methyl ester carboxylesterase